MSEVKYGIEIHLSYYEGIKLDRLFEIINNIVFSTERYKVLSSIPCYIVKSEFQIPHISIDLSNFEIEFSIDYIVRYITIYVKCEFLPCIGKDYASIFNEIVKKLKEYGFKVENVIIEKRVRFY